MTNNGNNITRQCSSESDDFRQRQHHRQSHCHDIGQRYARAACSFVRLGQSLLVGLVNHVGHHVAGGVRLPGGLHRGAADASRRHLPRRRAERALLSVLSPASPLAAHRRRHASACPACRILFWSPVVLPFSRCPNKKI